jgi:TolA-binding protein
MSRPEPMDDPMDDLGELARELPVAAVDPDRRARRRDALLDAIADVAPARTARTAPGRGWMMPAALGLAAAAAIAIVVVGWLARRPAASRVATSQATVQLAAAADLDHVTRVVDGVNDEIVRLRGGRISVAVTHLAPDQRFRVITGDAEVEVRGTAFDVVVEADRLVAVTVWHGLVEVRVHDGGTFAVAGGAQWSRVTGAVSAIAAAAPAPEPVPVPADPSSPPDPATTATAAKSASPSIAKRTSRDADRPRGDVAIPDPAATPTAADNERAFRAGRDAIRAGDFDAAATALATAITLAPDAPLAEDARYWHGVALARAGRDAEARRALDEFLARHPDSAWAGRAALIIATSLTRTGDPRAARPYLERALADPDAGVRASARAALAALEP